MGVEMKKIVGAVIATGFLLASGALHAVQIQMMLGDVKLERNKKAVPVKTAADMKPNDFLVTGNKSIIVLSFETGDVLKINENSRVLLTESVLKNGGVTIVRGSVEAKYEKISRDRASKIYTPTSVAAVRGTEFSVTVSESGESLVKMKEGTVNVANPSGETNVSGTDGAEIKPGAKPGKSGVDKPEDWKADKDSEFRENPGSNAAGFQSQLDIMKERSSRGTMDALKLQGEVQRARKPNQIEAAGAKIDAAKQKAEDDLNINLASGAHIDAVLGEYGKAKAELLGEYQRVRDECNKVAEQQARNIEEINKVLEAYQKARAEILEAHKKAVEDIKNKSKMEE